ncbi:MAG: tetraacyldisaccharide 4'-kinase [Saonia sp.]
MQLLRKIAFPISLVYALVVHLRNYLYDKGIFASKSFKTPTICVGNLSVGGTGKTPMIEFLVSELRDVYKIAVLSRGYGRRSKGFVWATVGIKVEELGDEPFQIRAKFPEITVAVDADRSNGISILEDRICPDIILLDDAYQHRKVKPSFSILLTAYDNLYSDDWYLPTGNLRDSRGQAKRADLIVVTKCPPDISDSEQVKIVKGLKPANHQQVLFSSLVYDQSLKGSDTPMSLEDLKEKEVTLVTGIARPKPLVSFLEKEGISFIHSSFMDHHFFTDKEIQFFNTKALVLTTEKDFVRLKGKVKHLYYIPVEHRFLLDGKEILRKKIKSL